MILSDVSVTRPILAAVLSLLLIAFGLVAFDRLPLREYPDIDPPVVSVETVYPGAAANVVETRITRLIEDRISGVEGIQTIESVSEDGRSAITIEFDIGRDIDGAANDVRDRVSRILDELPPEAEPPEIQKVDSNEDVIMWLNLTSDRMTVPELTDYARRNRADLIVVGVRPQSVWRKTLIGSTTEALIRRAPCAVLTVPPARGPDRSRNAARTR